MSKESIIVCCSFILTSALFACYFFYPKELMVAISIIVNAVLNLILFVSVFGGVTMIALSVYGLLTDKR